LTSTSRTTRSYWLTAKSVSSVGISYIHHRGHREILCFVAATSRPARLVVGCAVRTNASNVIFSEVSRQNGPHGATYKKLYFSVPSVVNKSIPVFRA
ncbi:MAG: hypothetical protein WBO14_03260, partial [Gammaproteobacteria bacterium]